MNNTDEDRFARSSGWNYAAQNRGGESKYFHQPYHPNRYSHTKR